jgi:hypothetical protein
MQCREKMPSSLLSKVRDTVQRFSWTDKGKTGEKFIFRLQNQFLVAESMKSTILSDSIGESCELKFERSNHTNQSDYHAQFASVPPDPKDLHPFNNVQMV